MPGAEQEIGQMAEMLGGFMTESFAGDAAFGIDETTNAESDKILKEGDIVNVDVTAFKDGWHGDTSRMFKIGEISIKDKLSLLKLITASDAFCITSCGKIQGPAEKLCFFIITLLFQYKILFQYLF